MEYNTNTERYVPTKEEFVMLLEGASIQSLCEEEITEVKDLLQRVVNTFARSTMPSAYRKVAQQARMHKNTRIYPNTQQDWIAKGWGIIETARSMNRAYARGER